EEDQQADDAEGLGNKGQGLFLNGSDGLEQADSQADGHGGQENGGDDGHGLEHEGLEEFGGELGVHNQVAKLWTMELTIRCQPSTSTNNRIFNGSEMVIGGIIIMPMLIRTVATTRSIRINGRK